MEKGKYICNPLVIPEIGCTSGTSDHCVSTLSTVPTKGHTHAKNICLATREQRDAYVSLKKVANCQYCAAKRFEYEPPTFCCGSGSIRLTAYKMPIELSKLYFENTEESEYFQTYIRTYNNMFIFTSLGVKYDKELAKRNCGIYTFRVQGQMYHFIDDLVPSNEKPKNLQLYFYDRDNELANRMAYSSRVNESIVQKLMGILKVNSYTVFLRSLLNVPKLADFYIALRCDSTLGQRTYNLPSASEIAAIWKENSGKENSGNTISAPHIRIYTHSNRAQLVNYYYDYYDPLQYPLLFSYGKNGWHCGIKIITHMNNLTRNRVLCEHEQLPSIENMCINRFSEWPKIPVLLQFCNSENRNIVSSIVVECHCVCGNRATC
ncbi:uncharacterized protein [Nicotiana tomentosiformis]|uniref:uncharacterized protein n=1 Tax=Nicotiana tomentosiformis TaxID=4098 RepID=UPI00051B9746